VTLPVVLVHGGAHGGWCWAPTTERMTAPTLAVDLPPVSVRGGPRRYVDVAELRTLTVTDFATAVLDAADTVGFPRFVLVGHSLAGITIPEVARRAPERVAHLVFLACSVPPEGGSILDCLDGEVAAMARTNLARQLAAPVGADVAPMDEAMARAMFGTDLDEPTMRFVLDRLGAEVMSVMDESVTRSGLDPAIPKTWVRTLRDAVVEVDKQDRFVANLEAVPGGPVTVVDLDTGHDAMLARPDGLAAVLDGIAAAAG